MLPAFAQYAPYAVDVADPVTLPVMLMVLPAFAQYAPYAPTALPPVTLPVMLMLPEELAYAPTAFTALPPVTLPVTSRLAALLTVRQDVVPATMSASTVQPAAPGGVTNPPPSAPVPPP